MKNNVILNHFNNIVASSKVDIERCVVYDNNYIIFELKKFFEMMPKNEELKGILTKYRIVFDLASNAILFTPFFKLVQEILIFNYDFYCKAFNNGEKNTKLLYVISQVFKHPCNNPVLLHNALTKVNKKTIENCKIRKTYDLNYMKLPRNFVGSNKINKKIFKIRGGNVQYQGTWVSFEYSQIIMELIGTFDVLKNLVSPIFLHLRKCGIKSKFNEQKEESQDYPFLLNKDSEIWNEFTNVICQQVKDKEYKGYLRLGKKRGKYNKTKNIGGTALSNFTPIRSNQEISLADRNVNLKFKVKNRKAEKVEILFNKSASDILKDKTLALVSNSKSCGNFLEKDGKTFVFNCSEKSLFIKSSNNNQKPVICASLLSVCTSQYNFLIRTEEKNLINILEHNDKKRKPETSRMLILQNSKPLNNTKKKSETCKLNTMMETPVFIDNMPFHTQYMNFSNILNEPLNGTKNNPSQKTALHLLKNTSLSVPEVVLDNTNICHSLSKRLLMAEINKPIVLSYFSSKNINCTVGGNYNYAINTKTKFKDADNYSSALLSDISQEINGYYVSREKDIYND